jgi:predicted NACHT family NTPase
MTGRSLQLSSEAILLAKKALTAKGLDQKTLIARLGCTRQPVSKFFNGKAVDSGIFCRICEILGLNAQDVACQDDELEVTDIDSLVQEVRQKIKPLIQERCGTMRVLDMTQPIGLNDIYTNVNILEKITGRRRKQIAELVQECSFEDFDRFGLSRITEERVIGLDAVKKYSKLMILGKPGSGKTTFLKYLAIQCNSGEFLNNCSPIFISIKDFAEADSKPGLLEYIGQQFSTCGVTATQVSDLFNHSKMLVLLDGLDEVREEDSRRILKEIRNFSISNEYGNNHFVMTCRIAAQEHTIEQFTEVEVADFDQEQISNFATNWFKNKDVKPDNFIKFLEGNHRVKEQATNPLLLTLLCLVFEESGNFPVNRSELYKEGIDAFLKKLDAKRGIYRDQVYKNLSVQRKEDLLSRIALNTFERSDYFFKQKVAEQHIVEYIRNLPDANTDPEALQLDSEKVLKSIEAQHGLLVAQATGIYSFSHVVFHEYFTAREFITVKQSSEAALNSLVNHMMDKRWREVLFLALGMSPSADRLLQLMKEKVDGIVASDDKLQKFLIWVSEQSSLVKDADKYKPAAVRAFYFDIDIDLDRDRTLGYFLDSSFTCLFTCASFLARSLKEDLNIIFDDFELKHQINDTLDPPLVIALERVFAIDRILQVNLESEPKLREELKQLKTEIPNRDSDNNIFRDWWKVNGKAWGDRVKEVIISHQRLGENWHLNERQKELLQQYYDANLLLILCLNSDCYVSREVRQYIEDTLLLPISEIRKYPKPNL